MKKNNKKRKIIGTAERPRLSVYKANRHIYAQIINDFEGRTLVCASTAKKGAKKTSNIAAAEAVGTKIASDAKSKGINKVVFDRGGFLYHGRVKALADAARKGGLDF